MQTANQSEAAPTSRKRPMLTDVALRALIKTPPHRQTDIPDAATPGLSARVTARGHVTWSLRLRVVGEGGQSARGRRAKGRQYRLSLGSYPAVTIKEARARAAAFARQAEAGQHPVRALEQQAVSRDATVERLVDTFMEEYATPNLRSWRNAKSTLHKHVVPAWGRQPVSSVDERAVAQLLGEVAKGEMDTKTKKRTPRPGAAGEVRKWGSILYSWAVRSGRATRNPFDKSKNPVRLKPRQRFLDLAEARAAWQATQELDQPWRDLVQLLLLIPGRMRELAHARWQWVDIAELRIVVPAEFYKSGRPTLIAIPPRAKTILEAIPRWNEGDYVFSTSNGIRPVWSVSRKILNKLHKEAERILGREIEHFTVHDFRRTARTHLSRLKVPDVVGELALGHALRGVAGTYNVYDFETEKRDALEKWAEELTSAISNPT